MESYKGLCGKYHNLIQGCPNCDQIALRQKDKTSELAEVNVYAKEVWNAAIEAAASLTGQSYTKAQANEIRKLKK